MRRNNELDATGTCRSLSRISAEGKTQNISDPPLVLTRVIEEVPDLVMVTDREGTIEYVNRAFEEVSGYPRSEVVGQRPRLLKSGQHEDAVYKDLWSTILSGKIYRGALINRRRDGQLFLERKAIVPVPNDNGRIARFIAIGTAVTEHVEKGGDVDNNLRLAQRLLESEEARRALSVQLLSAVETERKRIASDLHDDIGQILITIKMRVDIAVSLIQMSQADNAMQTLASVVPLIHESMDEVRRISMELRPSILDDLGIVSTIAWFCRRFAETCPGTRVEPDVRVEEREVPEDLKIVIYRVLQEAMNNVAKHAHASFARVQLTRRDQDLELTVEDNGCGFDIADVTAVGSRRRGAGLASMQGRLEAAGGSLSIQSSERVGTIVRGIFPCSG